MPFDKHIGQILKFTLISGVGWLLDLCVFISLTELAGLDVYYANFCSSYAGLLFVYFTSLQFVFKKAQTQSSTFLMGYWLYHFISIVAYSSLLHFTANEVYKFGVTEHFEIISKIMITPLNLMTNFIFMKLLTLKMRIADDEQL